ncbi:DJ-1/PfpI family protein [Amycolatopsis sp. A133]|uniref:DJ-1/PfpI family protein n=1 Tax=Amycolatopsis sp. A133 TaxID=3064472 RepID=UPI0027ED0BE5|nr:DJ-1/PfpI family protein [Amycolatopsis sp. A133]MDQ7809093.1 DJ-1/PfpI family protein [Amycolatopsis sp. A133]
MTGKPVRSSSGIGLTGARRLASVTGRRDTMPVVGGHGTEAAMTDDNLLTRVRRLAPRSRRIASVCTGAFVRAAAGLLDGGRATTHWGYSELMASAFPAVTVDLAPALHPRRQRLHLRRCHPSRRRQAGLDYVRAGRGTTVFTSNDIESPGESSSVPPAASSPRPSWARRPEVGCDLQCPGALGYLGVEVPAGLASTPKMGDARGGFNGFVVICRGDVQQPAGSAQVFAGAATTMKPRFSRCRADSAIPSRGLAVDGDTGQIPRDWFGALVVEVAPLGVHQVSGVQVLLGRRTIYRRLRSFSNTNTPNTVAGSSTHRRRIRYTP